MKIFQKIKSIPKGLKEKKEQLDDDIKLNRDTYKHMSYDWNAKLMNILYFWQPKKTSEEWLAEINKIRRKKGKKEYL